MSVIRKSPSDIIAKIVAILMTAFFAIVCVLPMWHVLMASFSDPIQLSLYEGFLFKPIKFSRKAIPCCFLTAVFGAVI